MKSSYFDDNSKNYLVADSLGAIHCSVFDHLSVLFNYTTEIQKAMSSDTSEAKSILDLQSPLEPSSPQSIKDRISYFCSYLE